MKKSSNKIVSRQHGDTQVPEVYGIPCSIFHAAFYGSESHYLGPMYLKLNDTWHRFYLDAGLLFWKEGEEPDPEDDLDNDEYLDWGQQLGVVGAALSEVRMKDSTLTLRFDNGAEVVLKYMPFDEQASILRFTSAD